MAVRKQVGCVQALEVEVEYSLLLVTRVNHRCRSKRALTHAYTWETMPDLTLPDVETERNGTERNTTEMAHKQNGARTAFL